MGQEHHPWFGRIYVFGRICILILLFFYQFKGTIGNLSQYHNKLLYIWIMSILIKVNIDQYIQEC